MPNDTLVKWGKLRYTQSKAALDAPFERPHVAHPWDEPPAPIPEDRIVETLSADVVVLGAGISGLACAARASQLGLSVVVAEKTATWSGRGGHIASLDSKAMREAGVSIDKQRFARDWMRIEGNCCKEEMVWLFINESGPAMDWMIGLAEQDHGVVRLYDGQYKGPDYTEYPGTHMFFPDEQGKYRSGRLFSHVFLAEAERNGVRFLYKAPAVQLEKEGGRVTAAIVSCEDGYRRLKAERGVVLATGDISGDKEMVAAYSPFALRTQRTTYMPPGANTGDGHKMGLWAGGVLHDDEPWAPMIHLTGYSVFNFGFLFVNTRGKRFMNEDAPVPSKSRKILMQPGGADYAWSVFDARWLDDVERTIDVSGGQFWDLSTRLVGDDWSRDCGLSELIDYYVAETDLGFASDTIEGLAKQIDVDPAALAATVSRYNELAHEGCDRDFGKRAELLSPVEQGPFYALKFGATLLAIVDGLDVDTELHVLDKDAEPIAGLWAVGNCAGGLYGVDYPVILNGNSHGRAMTWGKLAAESIARS